MINCHEQGYSVIKAIDVTTALFKTAYLSFFCLSLMMVQLVKK